MSHVFSSLFQAIGEKGWNKISLAELAKASELPLHEFYEEFPNKVTLLKKFGHFIDKTLLAKMENGLAEIPHDALFDIFMTRFELMAPYKKGILAVYNDLVGHLSKDFASLFPEIVHSLTWMGALVPQGRDSPLLKFPMLKLSYVYFQTLRTWLWDDSPDLNLTMVELDTRLQEIEKGFKMPNVFQFMTKLFGR